MKYLFILLAGILYINTSLQAQAWTQLGTGSSALDGNSSIYKICTDRAGNVYAGGMLMDDSGAVSVYKWNGASWSELGHGSTALHRFGKVDAIYADTAGNVYAEVITDSLADTTGRNHVEKWDGTSWSQVGVGASALYANEILDITMDAAGNLYSAGMYEDTVTGKYYVARWDGTTWSQVGIGVGALNANGYIGTMCFDDAGNLYAAGHFTDGDSNTHGNLYVAKWDGVSWSELGGGVAAQYPTGALSIHSIAADHAGNIYAAGNFKNSSGKSYVSKWDGTSWSELGSGSTALNANAAIYTITIDKYGYLYAAGSFLDTPGAGLVDGHMYVARWDGTSWTAVGGHLYAPYNRNNIFSLCTDTSGNLFAAGSFIDTTLTLYPDSIFYPHDTMPYHPTYVAKYGGSGTGIAPVSARAEISIFPSPADDIVSIRLGAASSGMVGSGYTVYDHTGRRVISGKITSITTAVSVESLKHGMYFVRIGTGSANTYKFLKE